MQEEMYRMNRLISFLVYVRISHVRKLFNSTPAKEEEKGFTEAEENTLDTIMQGLDLDSDGETEIDGNIDLDAIGQEINLGSDDDVNLDGVETHDFSAEFGV